MIGRDAFPSRFTAFKLQFALESSGDLFEVWTPRPYPRPEESESWWAEPRVQNFQAMHVTLESITENHYLGNKCIFKVIHPPLFCKSN